MKYTTRIKRLVWPGICLVFGLGPFFSLYGLKLAQILLYPSSAQLCTHYNPDPQTQESAVSWVRTGTQKSPWSADTADSRI